MDIPIEQRPQEIDPQMLLRKWMCCCETGLLFRATVVVIRDNGRNELRGITPDGQQFGSSRFTPLHDDQQYLLNAVFHHA